MTIEEFIRARLDEDEATCRFATLGPWRPEEWPIDHGREFLVVSDLEVGAPAFAIKSERDAQHIARHDPARVLRQVAALRAMMKHAEEAAYMDNRIEGEWGVGARDLVNDPVIDTLMHRDIAAIWRDHPDYRPEWDTPDQA